MSADDEQTGQNQRLLFVCSQNKLRSRSAENIFSEYPALEVKSAGTDKDATVPITLDLLEWADIIFVMEKRYRNIIHQRYKDMYALMDPKLIDLLKEQRKAKRIYLRSLPVYIYDTTQSD